MKVKLILGGQIRTGQVVSDTRVEVFFAVHQLWNPYIMHLLQFDSNLKNMFLSNFHISDVLLSVGVVVVVVGCGGGFSSHLVGDF